MRPTFLKSLPAMSLLTVASLLCLGSGDARAGELFVNGEVGRFSTDAGNASLQQLGGGYRWGPGPFKAGLEAGIGRIGETDGQYRDGTRIHAFTTHSRHFTVGANARIKPPLLPVQFIARAGYIAMRHSLDQQSTTGTPQHDSRNRGGSYVGAGIGTTILPLLDVSLMYTRYQHAQVHYDDAAERFRISDDKRSAESIGLTVEYRF